MSPRLRPGRLVPWLLLLSVAMLAACGGGPVRRVSEPAASLQQVTVQADGSWSVQLRLDNYSSVPMTFDAVSLAVSIDGHAAGTLAGTPALTIGPEAADVATLAFAPSADARLRIADALAARRAVAYRLAGRIDATPGDRGRRDFEIERESALTPVPGLPGVLR
jgi:hypothetical protein